VNRQPKISSGPITELPVEFSLDLSLSRDHPSVIRNVLHAVFVTLDGQGFQRKILLINLAAIHRWIDPSLLSAHWANHVVVAEHIEKSVNQRSE
jgi:hypothetical protein